MSSREIAELTGKEHKHVIRDIRDALSALTDRDKAGPKVDPLSYQGVTDLEKDDANLRHDEPKGLRIEYDCWSF